MKLLNYTTTYFAVIIFLVISVWAAIFYYSMLAEIYDSIDDGLDNQKQLIIRNAVTDTTLLNKPDFGEGGYKIQQVPTDHAATLSDNYSDTMMFMENENDYEPVRLLKTIFVSNNKYYELQVATSMVEEDDLVNALLYALLGLYVGIVLPVVLLNNFLLKKLWKPFYKLLANLKDFRVDKPTPITARNLKIEEFRLMSHAVQRMQQTNMQVYESQKHFIENAAHELQTPLAIAINKLEHLAENNTLSEEQLQLLSSALDNLDRLTRLNRSLLLLSKIENRQYTDERNINISETAQKVMLDFSDQLNYKHINVETNVEDLFVQMNYDLAVILITNLVKNAIVHTNQGGKIELNITKNELTISNSGSESLNHTNLFSRFEKQTHSSQSTGLGLSIVKAIIDLYGFTITYIFDRKHIIIIRF